MRRNVLLAPALVALLAAGLAAPAHAEADAALRALDTTVQSMPLPSLQARLRQRAAAQQAARQIARFFGFGDAELVQAQAQVPAPRRG